MSDYTKVLDEWITLRRRAMSEIQVLGHAMILLEEKVKAADKGLRQQQSAGIDEILGDMRTMRTMLATIQNKFDEPPPEDDHGKPRAYLT